MRSKTDHRVSSAGAPAVECREVPRSRDGRWQDAQDRSCHHEPLWTEPGWNAHKPAELKIDSFEADRSPDHSYKTMNLAGIFIRERGLFMKPEHKGRYYHDGRFQTLLDVVASYNTRFGLQLTAAEQSDLVEYLKSL